MAYICSSRFVPGRPGIFVFLVSLVLFGGCTASTPPRSHQKDEKPQASDNRSSVESSGPAGRTFTHTVASSENVYSFCQDGSARVEFRISEKRPHVWLGTWSMSGSTIKVLWRMEKAGDPVGEPVFCSSVCMYKEYRPATRSMAKDETLDWNEISNNSQDFWQHAPLEGDCSYSP